MTPDLQSLNAAQRDAVQTLNGAVLVLAGAGTGKTRVITTRIAALIRHGVPADKILSVTFTNKAAREMLERTRSLLGGRMPSRPWISTFHAFCVQLLRQDISRLGYPARFTILDRGDQESIARGVLRDIRVTEKSLRPGDLLAIISQWKSAGRDPSAAAACAVDDRDYLGAMAYRRYQQKLRATGAVDFDDLLLLAVELFEQHPDVLDRRQQQFSHVQIDEYQDTNGVQFRLVEALVRKHGNLCVVGDDDQSIYGWRGADVRHILGFGQRFPGAKVIRLEENYRCTAPILDAANRLVRHNRSRHPKVLRTNRTSDVPVRVLDYPDEQIEAEKVVGEIRFLIERRGASAREFAILFRTNEQPRLYESELRRQSVPYVLVGAQSFFDRKEVKDLRAYLQVLDRPEDDAALMRILNVPPRGIGASTSEKLLHQAVTSGRSFWRAADDALAAGDVPRKAAAALGELRALLEDFGRRFETQPRRLPELVRALVESIDYDREIEKQYKDPQQQMQRHAVVDEFIDAAAEYVERAEAPSLTDFLSSCALGDREEEPDKEEQAAQEAVKLMTMHSAKGLEFPRVYLVGMEEGLLPHKRHLDADDDAGIEEERRLCYVGVTRARDQLTLTRAASRIKWGSRRPTIPSRFLAEMFSERTHPGVETDETGDEPDETGDDSGGAPATRDALGPDPARDGEGRSAPPTSSPNGAPTAPRPRAVSALHDAARRPQGPGRRPVRPAAEEGPGG